MKKILMLFVAFLSFVSCFSQTQILNSWKDPNTNISNPSVHKIVVAALIYNQSVRRNVEDYMVTLYPGVATQSYNILGGDSILTDEHGESQRLQSLGYDGVVIMKQTSENTTQQYVPGMYGPYYHTWGGYWGNGWGRVYYAPAPGHVQNRWNWYVQVNVYSLINNTNNLVWTANTLTTNPGGRVPLFTDVCDAVRTQMTTDGFLR
jgi:hypothetical protein